MTMSQSPEESLPDFKRHLTYPFAGLVSEPGTALCVGAIGIALLAYVWAILTGPVLRGLDGYVSFSHLYVWIAELRAHEALSTWTPLDGNGYGSPLPFFYHKLFNLVGAVLTIASGSIITGYRLTILVFLATLFAGTFMCARRLGADRISSSAIATASVLAPYVLVKIALGTVAEYSASTLIPLVIALVLDARADRFGPGKAVALLAVLLLLELAHVLVAAMTFGVIIPLVVYLCVVKPKAYLALAATALALCAFIGLFLVPFNFWSTEFCPGQAIVAGGIANLLINIREVFRPTPFSGFGWLFFALMAGMALYLFRGRRTTNPNIHVAFVLGCMSFAVVFMMMKFTRPFWLLGGPLGYIQFPWRLLSVATPLCLIALAGLLAQLAPRTRRYAELALIFFALVHAGHLASLALHVTPPYSTEPTLSLEEVNREIPPREVIGPDAGGEYLPASFSKALAHIDVFNTETRISSILPPPRPFIEASGCQYPDLPAPATLHRLQLTVTCTTGGTLRVNQFATSFLDGVATNGSGTMIRPLPNRQFIEFSLPAGQWTVTIRQRGYFELVGLAWRARLAPKSR
jgi:hypothetical protein